VRLTTPPAAAVKLSFRFQRSKTVIKWGAITFGIGIAIIILEIIMAKRKKEGLTATDKQRIWGIFGVTLFATALVAGLIWMT
jgi:hypothetical protein